MAMTRTDETDLLLPLYDGVHEAPAWLGFLGRLRQRVRADRAGLIVRAADSKDEWWSVVPPEGAGCAAERAWREQLRAGRVYPLDGGHGRIVRAEEPGGARAWLIVERAVRDFSAADGALLARLAPHLAVALRSRSVIDAAERENHAAAAALERAGARWISFAADGRVLALGAGAAAVLGARWLPGVVIGGVAGAVADCAASRIPRAIGLREAPGGTMLLVPVDGRSRSAVATTKVLGLIRTQQTGDAALGADLLMLQWGLSPSEARLAVAIAGGASLTEAASALGLTIETARNYSKRVFAKSRTRGQVDLVRAVNAGLTGLA
jgi:DNA-binding CsgD family transcriptional regulator